MISFTNLGKNYPDGTRALVDVTFDVPRGQFCVLLGSSGAGKSTLLKCANGMVDPSTGRIDFANTEITACNRRQLQRRMAMIHQHFCLVPRLSVEANIITGAIAVLPLWRIMLGAWPVELRRRAAGLTAEMGLTEEQFRRRCADLSGGQQQRVGIARAFFLQPQLVLADEPVASLDPATSEGVLAALRQKAATSSTTVLCSLHQVELAREFADRIIGMKAGRVIFDVPASDLDEEAVNQLYLRTA
jgi:phosphonate transport system ATP-binding protein